MRKIVTLNPHQNRRGLTTQVLFGRIRIGVVGHARRFFCSAAGAGLVGVVEAGAGATAVVGAGATVVVGTGATVVVVVGAAVQVRTTLPSPELTPFSASTAVAADSA